MGVDYASVIERTTPDQLRENRRKAIHRRAEQLAREREKATRVTRRGRRGNEERRYVPDEIKIQIVADLICLRRAFPQKSGKDARQEIAADRGVGESTLRRWYDRYQEEAEEWLRIHHVEDAD